MLSMMGLYLMAGAVSGVLAGLLGIGGGLVIIPMLLFCFARQGIGQAHIMHMALGTSMASIIFTSVSSFRSHHKHGAVHWDIVKRIVPGILAGTLSGAYVASRMSTEFLKAFFVAFLYFVAIHFLFDKQPKASRQLPGDFGMFGVGNLIGMVSSLVGIGGGTLSVPFMILCNITVHHAIGTSAAIGFPIALSGTLGYIYNGFRIAGLPEYSAGYVYFPALAGLVSASVLTAPWGVRLAHRLPVAKLKRIFAILLLGMATRMLMGLL